MSTPEQRLKAKLVQLAIDPHCIACSECGKHIATSRFVREAGYICPQCRRGGKNIDRKIFGTP